MKRHVDTKQPSLHSFFAKVVRNCDDAGSSEKAREGPPSQMDEGAVPDIVPAAKISDGDRDGVHCSQDFEEKNIVTSAKVTRNDNDSPGEGSSGGGYDFNSNSGEKEPIATLSSPRVLPSGDGGEVDVDTDGGGGSRSKECDHNESLPVPEISALPMCASSTSSDRDIGIAIRKGNSLSDLEREAFLKNPWVPPESYNYPRSGPRNLCFKSHWTNSYPWLVYSSMYDGAFCKFCCLFSPSAVGKGGHQTPKQLVSQPSNNWKKALENFEKHNSADYHLSCKEKAESFLRIAELKAQNIAAQLNNKYCKKQVEENRNALESIAKTVILCGRQELALRGTNDSGEVIGTEQDRSENDGNFRSLLRFRCDSGDAMLQTHLQSQNKIAMYTSPTIQNEIIDICGSIIKEAVIDKVNRAGVFSVIADETTDISRIEQMSLCLRYVDPDSDKKVIREDFLEFIPVRDVTGVGLASTILSRLKENGICLDNLVGQGYDGARAMSGHLQGASTIVRQSCPRALYVHCSAHSLNLAIADSCKLQSISNCISTISGVGTFLRSSAQRNECLRQTIQKNKPNSAHDTIIAMCTTRWVQKHDSVVRFEELYVPIVKTQEEIESSPNREASQKASQLLASVVSFPFVIALKVCAYVMSITLSLCKILQSVDLDLVAACDHVDTVIETLRDARKNAESEFASLFLSAKKMIEEVDGEVTLPRGAWREKIFDEEGNEIELTPESYFRIKLFLPFIEHVIVHLTERFTKHRAVISSLEKLIPSMVSNATTVDDLLPCVEFYKDILPPIQQFSAELKNWKSKWKDVPSADRPKTALDALEQCSSDFYPMISKLLLILATLPVSTSTAERTFSTLRRLKSYLRNSTGETRLVGLALLSTHRKILVDPKEVVRRFALLKKRRLSL